MKRNKRILRAMSMADDRFITEADPSVKARGKRGVLLRVGALVACFALLIGVLGTTLSLAVGAWLFTPFKDRYPDVSQYKDSEYYDVIVKLNTVTHTPSPYKNNFEKYILSFFRELEEIFLYSKAEDMNGSDDMAGGSDMIMPPTSTGKDEAVGDAESGSDYNEITDNQVAGIIEADRIKRSSTHIFYLDGDTLKAYSIAGTSSAKVGELTLKNSGYTYRYPYEWEFYLSKDCRTVTVIAPGYSTGGESRIDVISVDVSDPENIRQTACVTFTGSYLSSRLVDGKLLLLTNFHVRFNPDFSNEAEFLPQCDVGNGMESIPADDIVYPEELSAPYYAVVYRLDASTLAIEDNSAFLSCSQNAYVSDEAVYLTRTFEEKEQKGNGKYLSVTRTEIFVLSYKERFDYKGSVCIDGYIKDQYSLDEHEGILRAVTTTSSFEYRNDRYGDNITLKTNATNADLVCIDLKELTVTAGVHSFAPDGETVRSVRFDKDAAYVCTSIELSDPVFFFDLSDLSNITVKDTGTIEGFSSSLINFGDGYLLGIGQGDSWSQFKIEVYKETATGVSSVCSYTLENTYYSTEYKSYYIDRENGLVGLGVNTGIETKYIVVGFDGVALRLLASTPLTGDISQMRGVYIDGAFYMFGENDFAVKNI